MRLATPLVYIFLFCHCTGAQEAQQTSEMWSTVASLATLTTPVTNGMSPWMTVTRIPSSTRLPDTLVTQAPEWHADFSSVALQQKWHLTTYWSCATFGPNRVFCGVHEPVLPGGDEIAAAPPRRTVDAIIVAVAAGLLAFGALFP